MLVAVLQESAEKLEAVPSAFACRPVDQLEAAFRIRLLGPSVDDSWPSKKKPMVSTDSNGNAGKDCRHEWISV